jgi:hypothetical protein
MPRLDVLLLLLLSLHTCTILALDFGDYAEPCKPFTCKSPGKKPVPKKYV